MDNGNLKPHFWLYDLYPNENKKGGICGRPGWICGNYEPAEEYQNSSKNSLKGVRVYHETFGYGTIISVEGQKCDVMFDKFGRKKIMGNFLRRV